MKRRTFLKALSAFLAAPLAFFGAKKAFPNPDLYMFGERTIESEGWFLENPSHKLYSRPGVQKFYSFGEGESVVGLTTHGERLIAVTKKSDPAGNYTDYRGYVLSKKGELIGRF